MGLRERIGRVLMGGEIDKLQEGYRLLEDAYLNGKYIRTPDAILRDLQELDSSMLTDLMRRMQQYDIVGYGGQGAAESEAERQYAVRDSERMWRYSVLGIWGVKVRTNFGLGDSVSASSPDPTVDEIVSEFWNADRNAAVLGGDRIKELSDWLLVTGNRFLAVYASTLDGSDPIVTTIPSGEITRIVTHPENALEPLYYERSFVTVDANGKQEQVTWFYPDEAAFFNGRLDFAVLPDDAILAHEQSETVTVCVMHVPFERKVENSLWGWPLLYVSAPYVKAHQEFMSGRLAVAQSTMMYKRRTTVKGGSRGVASVKAKLASTQTGDNWIDRNPPATPGSNAIENEAVTTEELPMTTGAGDAKTDNEIFQSFPLLAMGLFPTTAGMDTSRWATAVSMDKTLSMQWESYKNLWTSAFQRLCKIVLKYRAKYGGLVLDNPQIVISTDALSLVDFPGIVPPMAQAVRDMIQPQLELGVMPTETAQTILASLWRTVLQSLGVSDYVEITTPEAFGVNATPAERAISAIMAKVRDGTISEAQGMAALAEVAGELTS